MFSFQKNRRRSAVLLSTLAATLTILGATGCKKEEQSHAGYGAQAMPVKVLEVKTQPVALSRELPARLSAYRVAQVRARINGIVQKRLFTEGSLVKEGDILFIIDPAPYQAVVDSAKATLERAKANYASANAQAERFKKLVETNAISQQSYDDALALALASKADIAAAKAALKTAEINLGYTKVTSPITGRIGAAEVTEGAYVQQGTATLLATVQQLDPLYVDMNQSAESVLELRKALEAGSLIKNDTAAASVTITLSNGMAYERTGTLEFSDVTVNPTTGTVLLRGTLPNPNMELYPGMFVRASLDEGTDPNAILVPQSLVTRNLKGEATVLAVSKDNTVTTLILETDRTVGDQWLVTGGVNPGDKLITNNRQKVRPGAPVQVLPATAEQTAQ
jgi:membrane fusion protein (multidrug efflux system)